MTEARTNAGGGHVVSDQSDDKMPCRSMSWM